MTSICGTHKKTILKNVLDFLFLDELFLYRSVECGPLFTPLSRDHMYVWLSCFQISRLKDAYITSKGGRE